MAQADCGPRPGEGHHRPGRDPDALAKDAPTACKAINVALAVARKRAWALSGPDAPDHHTDAKNPLIVDLDATLVTAHSDSGGDQGRSGLRSAGRSRRVQQSLMSLTS